MTRILIADDHTIVRDGLRRYLALAALGGGASFPLTAWERACAAKLSIPLPRSRFLGPL